MPIHEKKDGRSEKTPTRMQRIIIAAMILIPIAAVAAYYYFFDTDTTGTSVAGTSGVVYLIEMALMLFVAIVSGVAKFSRRRRYGTQPFRRRVEKPRYWKKSRAEEARTKNVEMIIAIALLTAIIAMSYSLGAVIKAETMIQEMGLTQLGFLAIAWAGFTVIVITIAVILYALRGLFFRSS